METHSNEVVPHILTGQDVSSYSVDKMSHSVEAVILEQLNEIRNATTVTANGVIRLEEKIASLSYLQPKVDQTTAQIAAMIVRQEAVEQRMNRSDTTTRWAIGLVITNFIALAICAITCVVIYITDHPH